MCIRDRKYIDLINDSGFEFKVITNTINNLLTFLIYQIDSEIKDYELSIKDLELSLIHI